MKTKKFKTIAGLARALYGNQFTYTMYVSKRAYFKNGGWCNFELDPKARKEFARGIAGVIWSRPTEQNIKDVYIGPIRSYGILDRLWWDRRYKTYDYCCGQDWDAEMRFIRRIMKNG